jgi:predicted nucleotide-binding protein (sugar kinase/HSP70/actin superfamily)
LNGYGGLGDRWMLAAWRALVIGDLFDEMYATVLTGAADRTVGLRILEEQYQGILGVIDQSWKMIGKRLDSCARNLAGIVLEMPYGDIPKLSLVGEIYVRHDPISLQGLVERLADKGFIVRTATNSEWVKYVNWLIANRIEGKPTSGFRFRQQVLRFFDWQIRKRLAPSGLFFHGGDVGVDSLIKAGSTYISPQFTCESILTVGSAFHEILHPSCGIISIGPFGCMPSRVAEAILNEKFATPAKREMVKGNGNGRWSHILSKDRKLPFMAIETDGNPFPQIIEARLEAFSMQARRVNAMLCSPVSRQGNA